jgi:hypothetical protein
MPGSTVIHTVQPNPRTLPWPERLALRIQNAIKPIAWGSLLFAILQSICTFFAALGALRLALGLTWLGVAIGTARAIGSLHVDWLRIPMVILAVVGSLLNLLVLWQIRRLRSNPSAQWRQKPVTPRTLRMERLQALLALLTLVLIFFEERQHFLWHHHL